MGQAADKTLRARENEQPLDAVGVVLSIENYWRRQPFASWPIAARYTDRISIQCDENIQGMRMQHECSWQKSWRNVLRPSP